MKCIKKLALVMLLIITHGSSVHSTGKNILSVYYPHAQTILATLTLEHKIAQLMVVAALSSFSLNKEFIQTQPYVMDESYVKELILKYNVGGVIFLGSGTLQSQYAITKEFQQISTIPLLVCMDFEWGLAMRLTDALSFPRNNILGTLSSDDNELIYQMGYEIGKQCKALGVHMNLAPVVDIHSNAQNPIINSRSFGDDKNNVAHKAIAYMRGVQDAGIAACAKHFPGHGDTDIDSHFDLPRLSHGKERLIDVELYPFARMIDAGVMAIMSAHLEVPAFERECNLPSSLSYTIVTNLLKNDMGFEGLIITDGLGMRGVTKHHHPGELELKALQAGNDILLCPIDVPLAIETIKEAVLQGNFDEKDLDKKVLKVLALKAWAHAQRTMPPFNKQNFFAHQACALQQKIQSKML